MNYINKKIIPALEQSAEIASYQLFMSHTHSLESGFLNNDFGGIYRPVKNSEWAKISYKIIFNDGNCSIGSARAGIGADTLLAAIKSGSHLGAHPIIFAPKSTKDGQVKLYSQELAGQIKNQPEEISKITKQLQQEQMLFGHNPTDGGVEIATGATRLMNSNGVDLKGKWTKQSMYISFDDRVGFGHSAISGFSPSKLAEFSKHYSLFAKALSDKTFPLKSGTYPVLFDAGSGWSMLNTFILENVRGSAVDAGQSKFKLDDFKHKAVIAHPKFQLAYDQLIPMETGSFNFNSEGIPGQRFKLIQNGQLTEPICDLKTAKKLAYSARSLGGAKTKLVESTPYQTFVKNNNTFLLAFGVLGLHSANKVAGHYSLPAPDILVIKDGVVAGKVNATLSGNFFDTLLQPSTGFVDAPHLFDSPALTFETKVTVK